MDGWIEWVVEGWLTDGWRRWISGLEVDLVDRLVGGAGWMADCWAQYTGSRQAVLQYSMGGKYWMAVNTVRRYKSTAGYKRKWLSVQPSQPQPAQIWGVKSGRRSGPECRECVCMSV